MPSTITVTIICNLALAHLGEAPLTAYGEDTQSGRACSLHYVQALDATLRAHRWNFATYRVAVTADATAPVFGWSYRFALPSDCLRVLEVNDSEVGDVLTDEYVIENGYILTDADTMNLVYIARYQDPVGYDPLFVDAFALSLAVRLTESIRGTTEKTAALQSAYERIIAPLARRVDANEGRRRKGLLSLNSMFVRSRAGL